MQTIYVLCTVSNALLFASIVTEYVGHAKEIVEKLDVEKFDAIVVFSGDGLFHEAINGLCKRPDAMTVLKKCPLGTLPGGVLLRHSSPAVY